METAHLVKKANRIQKNFFLLRQRPGSMLVDRRVSKINISVSQSELSYRNILSRPQGIIYLLIRLE